MDGQTRLGVGAAALIAILSILEPHLIEKHPIIGGLIYLVLGAIVLWGVAPVLTKLRGAMLGSWGPWLLIIGGPLLGAVWLYVGPRSSDVEASSSRTIAHLAELGWTVKPNDTAIIFEVMARPLPPMKESANYFAQLSKPFRVHLQQLPSIEGLHHLAGIANFTNLEINAGEFTDVADIGKLTQLTKLGISQVPLNGSGVVDASPLSSLVNLRELNLHSTRLRKTDFLTTLTHLVTLNLGETLISDISAASALHQLESLEIRGTRVTDLSPISQGVLKELIISGAQIPGLVSFAPQSTLRKLQIIEQTVVDLTNVGNLTNLESLFVWGPTHFDLLPLSSLSNLRNLQLSGLGFGRLSVVENAQAISSMAELRTLTLGQLGIPDLNFANTLMKLEELNLNQLPVSSVGPLSKLILLKRISLSDVPVVDISPLLALPELTFISFLRVPAREDVVRELERRGVTVKRH